MFPQVLIAACSADELQEPCLEVIASSSARNGPEILPRCHTTNKSQVASLSAIGTITTFGMPRWEMKLGFSEIAPSFAASARLSARLVGCPMVTNRGRNLPNRRQNSVIFWVYPGTTLSAPLTKDSFFNCEIEICFWEASRWSRGRATKLGTLASLCV